MRLITTFDNEKWARLFSISLSKKGIKNECELALNADWGSHDYGAAKYKIWVIDEDQLEEAQRLLSQFMKNPEHPSFNVDIKPIAEKEAGKETLLGNISTPNALHPITQVTYFILFACILLFVIDKMSSSPDQNLPHFLPSAVNSSPIFKLLSYDYPHAFTLADVLVSSYGVEALSSPDTLPAEEKSLLMQYLQTPYWQGLYGQALSHFIRHKDFSFAAPMFEKIREGQWWRTFTPCLLHSDIFHILFNMIWLIVLGKQMEVRMGNRRLLLFIGLAGIFSNTAQYLMGGANFIGFSGVLCAMLAFVWVRERKAPWEGYNIQRSTLSLMAIFVLAMLAIQVASFMSEIFFQKTFSPGIANTAHLTGAFIGYILGNINFFSVKKSPI